MKYGEIIKNIMGVLKNFLCVFISVLILCVNFCSCASNSDSDADHISDNNYVSLAYGFTDTKITDEKSAIAAISEIADQIGIEDVENELKTADINKVGQNTYYRFQQYYNDIPVYGKSVVVAADESGNAITLNTNFEKIEGLEYGEISEYNNPVIYIKNGNSYLCTAQYETKGSETYLTFNNVKNGKVIDSLCQTFTLNSKEYNENDYKDKQKNGYRIFDKSRNLILLNSNQKVLEIKDEITDNGNKKRILYTDDNAGNTRDVDFSTVYYRNNIETKIEYNINNDISFVTASNIYDFDKTAVNTIESVEKVYQYYFNALNRTGFDGHNSKMYIAYNDKFYNDPSMADYYGKNASSSEGVLKFGYEIDTSSVDIVAHEFTHSVEQTISHMTYSGESGAVMEGYSDIFGEIIQAYYNSDKVPDWLINCAGITRNIADPESQNLPKSIKDSYFKTTENQIGTDGKSTNDNGNVHDNSTVISHAGYLMWNGIDGNKDKKIDCETLAELWYESLYVMQSNTTFKQCANAITLTATQMVREGTMTPNQLQCVLEAFDEVGIQNDKSYSVINSGATLTVNDIRLNPYDNYHLTVSEVPSLDDYMENKTLGDVVIDTDISSENGYALDLDPGRYCIRVKDNYENGSSNEFTKIITVIEPSVRNEFFPVSDSVTIFTDFGSLISAMTDYIGMTFEEITELYGTDYELYHSESGEENQLVITYTNESVPFSYVFQCSAESFAAEVPDADDTVKTVDFHQGSTTAISVDDVVFPHTKYAQLKSNRDGLLWKDVSLYSYTYKVGEISVNFKYYTVPTDDSIADFITVTLRDWSPSEADAKAVENEILYRPVLDYYGEKCTKEHKENEITYCYCGAYFGDIDGNGTEELLIEEGFSEQGRTQHIYTIQNGEAVELGSYNAWHLALYDDEIGDGKLVAVVTDPSGPWIIYNITIESNSINQTEINKSNDYPSYSNPIEFLPIYTFLSDYLG